jgi:Flp pilus assembly CpaE family ATPase
MRRTLQVTRLHAVPNSYKDVNTAINHGNPLMAASRSNAVAKNLAEFALVLNPKPEENRGLFNRFFKRA